MIQSNDEGSVSVPSISEAPVAGPSAPSSPTPSEHVAPVFPEFKPGWRFYMAFLSLAIITLAVALDATTISVALPIIAQDINGTAIEAFWAGTSFLSVNLAFCLLCLLSADS